MRSEQVGVLLGQSRLGVLLGQGSEHLGSGLGLEQARSTPRSEQARSTPGARVRATYLLLTLKSHFSQHFAGSHLLGFFKGVSCVKDKMSMLKSMCCIVKYCSKMRVAELPLSLNERIDTIQQDPIY